MTDQPSSAAQAVWLAAWQHSPVNCESVEDRRRQQIAAVLRAAADQLAQTPIVVGEPLKGSIAKGAAVVHVADILAIAAELEALP